LRGVRGVTAREEHCIVVLACNVVRLDEGVRTKIGGAILAQGADYNGGHREEQGCLIKIIHNA
jgi:hypothetical protein